MIKKYWPSQPHRRFGDVAMLRTPPNFALVIFGYFVLALIMKLIDPRF